MLKEQLKVGDRVVMKMDKEARAWGRKGPADGTEGTVVRKARITRYHERVGYNAKEQGVYTQDGGCVVEWSTGEKTEGDDYSLYLVDEAEARRRYKEEYCDIASGDNRDNQPQVMNDLVNRLYVGPLPETKFWEGDAVSIADSGRLLLLEGEVYTIHSIDYSWGERMNDWRDNVMYTVQIMYCGQSAGTTMLRERELELLTRGNVWKHFHNEPLVWPTDPLEALAEEAKFAMQLNTVREVRNPRTDNYAWTKDEVLEAIKAGTVHGFSMSAGFFGTGPRPSAQVFEDLELGERVRQATLDGFKE